MKRRREFLALVGGAAAWPVMACGQERLRRIGVLMGQPATDPVSQSRNAAFLQGLQQLGWMIGRNVEIEYRWAPGDVDNGRRNAEELVALAPDVMLATGGAPLAPLLQVTRTVPIVFVQVTDPVGAGYVQSLARPGGNATGFIPFEFGTSGKWLELLKEIAPWHKARGGASRGGARIGHRAIGSYPVCVTVVRVGIAPGRRRRCQRDRARHHRLRPRS